MKLVFIGVFFLLINNVLSQNLESVGLLPKHHSKLEVKQGVNLELHPDANNRYMEKFFVYQYDRVPTKKEIKKPEKILFGYYLIDSSIYKAKQIYSLGFFKDTGEVEDVYYRENGFIPIGLEQVDEVDLNSKIFTLSAVNNDHYVLTTNDEVYVCYYPESSRSSLFVKARVPEEIEERKAIAKEFLGLEVQLTRGIAKSSVGIIDSIQILPFETIIFLNVNGSSSSYLYYYNTEIDIVKASEIKVSNSTVKSGNDSKGSHHTTHSTSRTYHRGSRGGCYYYSASGKKVYVDRSLCN